MLQPGDAAPFFSLPDWMGLRHPLSGMKGGRRVIYSYPGGTAGCERQGCEFRNLHGEFWRFGVRLLGLSPQAPLESRLFSAKCRIPFPLLADAGGAVARRYSSWGEKTHPDGRLGPEALRNTFVIDAWGKVERIFPGVNPAGHAEEVLQYVAGTPRR